MSGLKRKLTLRAGGETRAFEVEASGADLTLREGERTTELTIRPESSGELRLSCNGREVRGHALRDGDTVWVSLGGRTYRWELDEGGRRVRRGASEQSSDEIRSPMTGILRRLLVSAGDRVEKGQPLLAVEAMKMEHVVKAPRDATVAAVTTEAGRTVDLAEVLLRLEPEGPA